MTRIMPVEAQPDPNTAELLASMMPAGVPPIRLFRTLARNKPTNDLYDETWNELTEEFTDAQLLDLILLCGWYRTISGLCRALRIDLEHKAPRFSDYCSNSGTER
jgi:hypothetical protein